LAELEFRLPRLSHRYTNLARQRGGSYGAKGSGETRFETDRRLIEQRIARLKRELETLKRQRGLERGRRQKQRLRVCALLGYTNSGKSSLLNALSGAEQDAGRAVYAEDRLFATLDTTTRRMKLGGKPVLLVDTVGFIRRLPHTLIDAFRATLEEAATAEVLLLVLDAADPAALQQYRTTLEVLEDLRGTEGAATGTVTGTAQKTVVLLNKIDLITSDEPLQDLEGSLNKQGEKVFKVSAKSGKGIDVLKEYLVNI
jgi:GTP-binding protein HflX